VNEVRATNFLARDPEFLAMPLSQIATCYYQSNHSEVEAVLLSSLPCPRIQQANFHGLNKGWLFVSVLNFEHSS